jgi:hypothetical protein
MPIMRPNTSQVFRGRGYSLRPAARRLGALNENLAASRTREVNCTLKGVTMHQWTNPTAEGTERTCEFSTDCIG